MIAQQRAMGPLFPPFSQPVFPQRWWLRGCRPTHRGHRGLGDFQRLVWWPKWKDLRHWVRQEEEDICSAQRGREKRMIEYVNLSRSAGGTEMTTEVVNSFLSAGSCLR